MGRPRKITEESTKIHLVVPNVTLDGYDDWVKHLHATVPGGKAITAADLMRDALAKVLREWQAEMQATAARSNAPAKPPSTKRARPPRGGAS